MQLDEKLLGVAVETTLTGLIGIDLHERIVPAFHLDAELERAEWTGEITRATRGAGGILQNGWKERIGNRENLIGLQVGSKKMAHR